MKDFVVGDCVHVVRIGTGIVREARNGGRYLVEIKGRTLVIAGSQLERATPEPAKGYNVGLAAFHAAMFSCSHG